MAPKRLLKHVQPADSSSEEEPDSVQNEEEEEEQENGNKNGVPEGQKSAGDHDTEDEEQPEKVKSPVIVKKPTVSRPNDESGWDSETESDKTPPSPSPTVSKPVDGDSSKPKKKPQARSSNKRESEKDEKEKKKKRKVGFNGGGDNEDTKKASGVMRLWSDDDEVALLKGMTDYKAENGTDPNTDVVAFRDFIKERLSMEVSRSQLWEKIRRLKKKYQKNAAKGENGEDPVFSKTHDSRSFQLSKKVWGKKSSGNGSIVEDKDSKSKNKEMKREKVQADGKLKAEKEEDDEDEDVEDEEEEEVLAEKYPFLNKFLRPRSFSSENERLVRVIEKFMQLMESSHLKDLEEKLKKQQIEEMELHLRRTKLIYEQEKLVLSNIKNM